jgi:hypothetical protein
MSWRLRCSPGRLRRSISGCWEVILKREKISEVAKHAKMLLLILAGLNPLIFHSTI